MARERRLTSSEIAVAKLVFSSTIDYDKVIVSDNIGWEKRAFTTPSFNPFQWGCYFINMGEGYKNLLQNDYWKRTMIHELTHVWQGMHSWWAWNYVFNSVWHQGTQGKSAYDYKTKSGTLVANSWTGFNVEQQAHLVEEWFAGGRKTKKDNRYQYIRNNIRAGVN